MLKFMKLTNFSLNIYYFMEWNVKTNDIDKIVIQKNKYYIHIVSEKIDSFNVNGSVLTIFLHILLKLKFERWNIQIISK